MKTSKEFLDTLIKYIDAKVDGSSLCSIEELKQDLYEQIGYRLTHLWNGEYQYEEYKNEEKEIWY